MNKRKCIQCGNEFFIPQDFINNKKTHLKLPKKCPSCRDFNKKEKIFIQEQFIINYFENSNEKIRIRNQKIQNLKTDMPINEEINNLFIIGNGF